MYFVDVSTAVASLKTFWDAIKPFLPSDVTVTVENTGDTIDSVTGALTGAWSSDPETGSNGESSDKYSAPAGCVINWNTETIGPHRRLRGRTFLVPLAGPAYQNDGSLGADTLTGIRAAAAALITDQSASFCVWHRGNGSGGTTGIVTSASVHDMVSVLRSRRD